MYTWEICQTFLLNNKQLLFERHRIIYFGLFGWSLSWFRTSNVFTGLLYTHTIRPSTHQQQQARKWRMEDVNVKSFKSDNFTLYVTWGKVIILDERAKIFESPSDASMNIQTKILYWFELRMQVVSISEMNTNERFKKGQCRWECCWSKYWYAFKTSSNLRKSIFVGWLLVNMTQWYMKFLPEKSMHVLEHCRAIMTIHSQLMYTIKMI